VLYFHLLYRWHAIAILNNEEVGLVLLGIRSKSDKTCLYIANEINETHNIAYIFTTADADDETVLKASELGPYGYLVKPYGLNDIKAAVEIVISNFQKSQKIKKNNEGFLSEGNLFVRVDSKLIKLIQDEILFIESKGGYTLCKTTKKGYIVHSTLKNVVSKMNNSKFIKVHRSYISNINEINDILDSSISIQDNIIPISRKHKANLMKHINLI
jgi:DNA-binding LytR/AlgR family response regulator